MSTFYPVIVDYDIAVEEAIKLGNYDWVEKFITQNNFPNKKKGKGELIVDIIHLNCWVFTEEVLKELDRIRYRPVDFMELLAFSAKYPDVQREFTVVALGSVYRLPSGYYSSPTLHNRPGHEDRWLCSSSDPWYPESRFAAVRK